MKYQEGYVYHIKEEYFEKVQDNNLMKNKEGGLSRPTFFCLRDKKNPDLLWVVPMSSRVEKYRRIKEKQLRRYKKCLTIVIGKFDGRPVVFLLQNMFPITEKYLSHIHTRKGTPVSVRFSIQKVIRSNIKQIFRIMKKEHTIVFPDVID